MSLNAWTKSKVVNLTFSDIQLVKLSIAAATLMIAKLWKPLLHLKWYWYGIISILAVIKPFYSVYGKK